LSEIQTISVVVAATSVVVFVANSLITSRREEKRSQETLETREFQLLMQLQQQINSQEMGMKWNELLNMEWRDYDDTRAFLLTISIPCRARKRLNVSDRGLARRGENRKGAINY
jgi:hypothetical protein